MERLKPCTMFIKYLILSGLEISVNMRSTWF